MWSEVGVRDGGGVGGIGGNGMNGDIDDEESTSYYYNEGVRGSRRGMRLGLEQTRTNTLFGELYDLL